MSQPYCCSDTCWPALAAPVPGLTGDGPSPTPYLPGHLGDPAPAGPSALTASRIWKSLPFSLVVSAVSLCGVSTHVLLAGFVSQGPEVGLPGGLGTDSQGGPRDPQWPSPFAP